MHQIHTQNQSPFLLPATINSAGVVLEYSICYPFNPVATWTLIVSKLDTHPKVIGEREKVWKVVCQLRWEVEEEKSGVLSFKGADALR